MLLSPLSEIPGSIELLENFPPPPYEGVQWRKITECILTLKAQKHLIQNSNLYKTELARYIPTDTNSLANGSKVFLDFFETNVVQNVSEM